MGAVNASRPLTSIESQTLRQRTWEGGNRKVVIVVTDGRFHKVLNGMQRWTVTATAVCYQQFRVWIIRAEVTGGIEGG